MIPAIIALSVIALIYAVAQLVEECMDKARKFEDIPKTINVTSQVKLTGFAKCLFREDMNDSVDLLAKNWSSLEIRH